jgi:hypothetical protein
MTAPHPSSEAGKVNFSSSKNKGHQDFIPNYKPDQLAKQQNKKIWVNQHLQSLLLK